jgi:hypothetical protein
MEGMRRKEASHARIRDDQIVRRSEVERRVIDDLLHDKEGPGLANAG